MMTGQYELDRLATFGDRLTHESRIPADRRKAFVVGRDRAVCDENAPWTAGFGHGFAQRVLDCRLVVDGQFGLEEDQTEVLKCVQKKAS